MKMKFVLILNAIATVSVLADVGCYTGIGLSYNGTQNTTWRNYECQSWNKRYPQDHKLYNRPWFFPSWLPAYNPCQENVQTCNYEAPAHNYCRNPTGQFKPWCFTTSPKKRWDFCKMPKCHNTDVGCYNGRGVSYDGNKQYTKWGYKCQRWDMQSPHYHNWGSKQTFFPGRDVEHNYCRNPDGKPEPWCFTTNPNKRYDYCGVPKCRVIPGGCSQGFIRKGKWCYKGIRLHRSWLRAKCFCKSNYNALLAEPKNPEEILNVIEIAQDLKDSYSGSNDVWLYGARGWVEHDSHLYFNIQFGLDFYWQSNYKKVSEYWTNWAPGEPNFFNKEQGCLRMWYDKDYRWDDDNCERRKLIICQKPPQ